MTVVIGTAGHIDHGKTTLLRALTGIDADRLPEERRRGMTIDVGYAHLALPDGTELDFVDVPGHDRLVGNMLVGAGEIDAAMLVVAADDGPRAQTLEHLELLDALGIEIGIAVITKLDLAGAARATEVAADVGGLLAESSLRGSRVVVSRPSMGLGSRSCARPWWRCGTACSRDQRPAGPGEGRAWRWIAASRSRDVGQWRPARFGADRSSGARRSERSRGSTRFGRASSRSTVRRSSRPRGDGSLSTWVALNLRSSHRGVVLTDDPAVESSDRLLVRLARSMPDRMRARVHLGTASVDGAVGRTGRDAIDLAGGSVAATLRLGAPIAVAPGDRFVLRRAGGTERIVGGIVLDVAPPRGISRRRQTKARVMDLANALDAGDPIGVAAARLALHGAVALGNGPVELAADVAEQVAADVLAAFAEAAGVGGGPAEHTLPSLRTIAARSLRRQVTLEKRTTLRAAAAAVERLVEDGRLVREGASVRLPGSRPTGALDPALVAAMDRLEHALSVAAPPALAAAAREAGCSAAGIRELERAGRIVLIEPDLAYATPTFRETAAPGSLP